MCNCKKGHEVKITIWAPVLYPWMIKLRDVMNERGFKAVILSEGAPKNYRTWRKYESYATIPKSRLFRFLHPFLYLLKSQPNLLIVFATESFTSLGLIMLSKVFKIPAIPIVEDNCERRYNTLIKRVAGKLKQLLIRYVYNHSDVLVAESFASRDYLMRIGCPIERIKVIPHGTDVEKFQQVDVDVNFLKKYKIPDTRKMKILYLGGFNYYKGIDYLVEATQDLALSETMFLIPVFGPLIPRYELILRKQKNTCLISPVEYDDMVKLYSFADVVVVPSITNEEEGSERSPNVIIEALACSRVVIGTDVGGIPTYIGDAGLIIKEKSSKAIVDAIARLASNEKLMKELKVKARHRAEKVLNIKIYGESLLKLYKQCFGSE